MKILAASSVLLIALQSSLLAQSYPPSFTGADLATGMAGPSCFCIAQDGTAYICQQVGTMRVWKEGTGLLADQFFIDNPLVVDSFFERGLIGVAVDPNFLSNRYIYVYYTTTTPTTHNRISRFTANASGERAIAGTETILLELNNLSAGNHNGGGINFGPDGKLYAGVGENAVGSNSQSINNLLGKMLRISTDPLNVIPSDNPTSFPGIAGSPTGNNRAIWAVGLRNPFTSAFQPGTGRLFINDVGQSAWEEVNDGIAGRNYGWPTTEGPFNPVSFPNFTNPFYAYQVGSAICGGAFYNPPIRTYPADYLNDYFFGELSGRIDRIETTTPTVTPFGTSTGSVVDLRIDAQGRLLYLNRSLNKLIRVGYNTPFAPSFDVQPAETEKSICTRDTVQFSVNIAGNPAPSIIWRKDDVDLVNGGGISGVTTTTLTITNAQTTDDGTYKAFIQNASGDATSNEIALTVIPAILLDGSQIQPFVDAILAQAAAPPQTCWFDFDDSGLVDLSDIDEFTAALLAP